MGVQVRVNFPYKGRKLPDVPDSEVREWIENTFPTKEALVEAFYGVTPPVRAKIFMSLPKTFLTKEILEETLRWPGATFYLGLNKEMSSEGLEEMVPLARRLLAGGRIERDWGQQEVEWAAFGFIEGLVSNDKLEAVPGALEDVLFKGLGDDVKQGLSYTKRNVHSAYRYLLAKIPELKEEQLLEILKEGSDESVRAAVIKHPNATEKVYGVIIDKWGDLEEVAERLLQEPHVRRSLSIRERIFKKTLSFTVIADLMGDATGQEMEALIDRLHKHAPKYLAIVLEEEELPGLSTISRETLLAMAQSDEPEVRKAIFLKASELKLGSLGKSRKL